MISADFVTVVSGFQRSGTSLMMQMLAAGGLPVLINDFLLPNEHNPRGYFEFSHSNRLGEPGESVDWVPEARGRAVKVFAYRLELLPPTLDYRVIYMRRKITEVVASWRKSGLCRPDCTLNDQKQVLSLKMEYAIVEAKLMKRPDAHMRVMFVSYNELLANPGEEIRRVLDFLELPLDAKAMAEAIDPALYRCRFT